MTEPAPARTAGKPRLLRVTLTALLTLLVPVTIYELLIVGLDTYGYALSRRSSYMIFFNGFLVFALLVFMFRCYRRTIGAARILRPEGWMAVCMTGSLVTLYWAWAVDRWLRLGLMGDEGAWLSLSPATLAAYVSRFYEKGLWGWGIAWYYEHTPVTGTTLLVWWLLEASLMMLVPSAFVWRFLSRHPQCSGCGGWMHVQEAVRRMQGSRAARVLDGVLAGNYGILEEPDTPQKGDPFTVRIDLSRCDRCLDAVYLSLHQDGNVLLWLHPFPSDQVPKVHKSVRGSSAKRPNP